jgi:DNA (cytosine-5)-methyltransferase 1
VLLENVRNIKNHELEKSVDEKYYLSERIKPTILSNGRFFISEINQLIARPLTAYYDI